MIVDFTEIADKTAQFVAKNGTAFEQRILNNDRNTVKFGFLLPGNPYNPYYQSKVKEFKEGGTASPWHSVNDKGAPADAANENIQPDNQKPADAFNKEVYPWVSLLMVQTSPPPAPVPAMSDKGAITKQAIVKEVKKRALVEPPPDEFVAKLPDQFAVPAIDVYAMTV